MKTMKFYKWVKNTVLGPDDYVQSGTVEVVRIELADSKGALYPPNYLQLVRTGKFKRGLTRAEAIAWAAQNGYARRRKDAHA